MLRWRCKLFSCHYSFVNRQSYTLTKDLDALCVTKGQTLQPF